LEGECREWLAVVVLPHLEGASLGVLALDRRHVGRRGRYSTTASRIGCTPRLRSAAPQSTGTRTPATVPRRSPPLISSSEMSCSSRYLCMTLSSKSATASIRTSPRRRSRSEEHTSELQSRVDLVCRLLLEK